VFAYILFCDLKDIFVLYMYTYYQCSCKYGCVLYISLCFIANMLVVYTYHFVISDTYVWVIDISWGSNWNSDSVLLLRCKPHSCCLKEGRWCTRSKSLYLPEALWSSKMEAAVWW